MHATPHPYNTPAWNNRCNQSHRIEEWGQLHHSNMLPKELCEIQINHVCFLFFCVCVRVSKYLEHKKHYCIGINLNSERLSCLFDACDESGHSLYSMVLHATGTLLLYTHTQTDWQTTILLNLWEVENPFLNTYSNPVSAYTDNDLFHVPVFYTQLFFIHRGRKINHFVCIHMDRQTQTMIF